MTAGDQWQAPSPTGDGREARLGVPPACGGQPEETAERRVAGWQRALRWVAWLTFLGLAVWKSASVYFAPIEWAALIAAIGISIWCLAKPLGGPKVELSKSTHLLGAFVSRTSWGLVLFGAILTIGGVAGAGAAFYDLSSGRATVGDVFKDIAIFIEGWITELIVGVYDAEHENTHAYALFLLLLPGFLLLWFNLIPFFNRGTEFRVDPDGSVTVLKGDSWEPLMDHQYSTVTADGTTIDFTPPADGPRAIVLPQYRVFPASPAHGCATTSVPSSSGGFWPAEVSQSRARPPAAASPHAGRDGLGAGDVARIGRVRPDWIRAAGNNRRHSGRRGADTSLHCADAVAPGGLGRR